MAYFKDDADGYYVTENDSNGNLTEISQAEYEQANQPLPLSVAERRALKQRDIDALEVADKCGRRYREGYLLSCVKEATALGFTEPQAYAANPGYKGAKDLNSQITALRAELRAIV